MPPETIRTYRNGETFKAKICAISDINPDVNTEKNPSIYVIHPENNKIEKFPMPDGVNQSMIGKEVSITARVTFNIAFESPTPSNI